MNKKWIAVLLALVLACACLAGCGPEAPTEPEVPEVPEETPAGTESADVYGGYGAILVRYRDMIVNPDHYEPEDGILGILEAAQSYAPAALSKIGYLMRDINGDGIEELIIGLVAEEEYSPVKNTVLALYTLVDGAPVFVCEGRSRSSYSLLEGNSLYYYGSNGAAYTIFGEQELTKDGTLGCKDFYFSYHKGNDYNNIGFFHNTTGAYETSAAEELKISEDAFRKLDEALAEKTIALKFTPFSEVKADAQTAEPAQPVQQQLQFFGRWSCLAKANDGSSYLLVVELTENGSASYKVGPPESEFMVDCRGSWTAEGDMLTLNMRDRIEGFDFNVTCQWSMSDGQLALRHTGGDAFLYDQDGKTYTFSKN